MLYVYPAVIHEDSDGIWAEFPDLPGCQAFSDSVSDLLADGDDGVEGVHSGLGDDGDLPPAQAAQLARLQGQDITPAHQDTAGGTGQAHHLVPPDSEAEPVDADDAATSAGTITGVVLDAQVLDT